MEISTTVKLFNTSLILLLTACSGGPSNTNGSISSPSKSKGTFSAQSGSGLSSNVSSKQNTCTLDNFEQDMLNAINTVRTNARSCGNENFTASLPVSWNCKLKNAASVHSIDMASNNFFSHIGSDGLTVNQRVDQTKYDWQAVSENLAEGYLGVDLVINAWLASPSHCKTLMDKTYKDVGVSISMPDNADYSAYWTLVMGNMAAPTSQ